MRETEKERKKERARKKEKGGLKERVSESQRERGLTALMYSASMSFI